MSATIRMTTTVLPGHKIEITSPELPVGGTVDVTVTVPTAPPVAPAPESKGILDFINSSPFRKTAEEWEQFERDFQEERNSWDR
jgi:hypothetical protein